MKRQFLRPAKLAFALSVLQLCAFDAGAQIALSANDNKAVLADGVNVVPDNAAADTVSIIDLGATPPKVIGEVKAPASVVGPPQSVAISPDVSFALVTGAFKVDPADRKKAIPDNKLSVIDLKAKPPGVVATLEAGLGAAGVSINSSGTLALVANRNEGTVSVFTIAGNKLAPAGKIQLGDSKSGPSHVAFTPDGKRALVTRDGDHRISILSVDGNKVEDSKMFMVGGVRPYSLEISSKGNVAVVSNQGGGQGDIDTITVIDLKSKPPRVVDTISVGQTPEGVAMSADGSYVAVTVMNGSNRPKSHPAFNDYGLLQIYSIKGTNLTKVAQAKVGHWCQGAAFSKNNKTVVIECMVEKNLQAFRFDGHTLKPAGTVALSGGGAGLRTAAK
ncbi:MAG TPA: YncE family protein [Pseudolabrys sp.]|nr:YncE family protein [Pseudolabrys sp.]